MNIILFTISILAISFAIYEKYNSNRLLKNLNNMLDKGLSSDYSEDVFDETNLSKIESKLYRLIDANKLSQDNLEIEYKRVQSLIGDISHQTKTPIANILMYLELLLESELDEDSRILAEEIKPHVNKLHFLIQALIKTSRLEMGIIKVKPEKNNLKTLLNNIYNDFVPTAKGKDIAIELIDNGDIFSNFDTKWTQEALSNILDNAIKYSPKNSIIKIKYYSYEIFNRIDIIDNGIGIDEENYGRIFERFWRDSSLSRVEGVGIGLYLTREIINQQGGYIKVNSVKDNGSIFSIFLPK